MKLRREVGEDAAERHLRRERLALGILLAPTLAATLALALAALRSLLGW